MMADWLHCNLCFYQPGDGRTISLTNCGHVYCEQCLHKGTNNNRCEMCGGSPCTTIKLTSKMKPDVEIFFLDPAEIIKKQQKQLFQVMEFQKNHRRRLITHLKEQLKKQQEALRIPRQDSNFNKAVEREILVLKEENGHLKKLIHSMKQGQGNRPSPGRPSPGRPSPGRPSPGGPSGRPSPQYQRKSPGQHLRQGHLNSPGSRLSPASQAPSATPTSTARMALSSHQSLPTTPSVASLPHGPARITVRTPPSGGKMGVIPGRENITPSSQVSFNMAVAGSGGGGEPCTPGGPSCNYSPMQISPQQTSLKPMKPIAVPRINTPSAGLSHLLGRTKTPITPTSEGNFYRRPIQLPVTPQASQDQRSGYFTPMQSQPPGQAR